MNDDYKDLHFPKAGIDVSQAFSRQPNRPVFGGEYARTTAIANNVRGFTGGRDRGGSRSGLKRYIRREVSGEYFIVQELRVITIAGENMVQASNSGRIVTLVAVSQGDIFIVNPGDTEWLPVINNTGETPPLNFTGLMMSTQCNQKLWFVDGINYVTYDPFTNIATIWEAVSGDMPQDEDGNYGRLICTWRGRVVVSGLLLDPQNWFMSAVSDPTDWDYSPLSITPTQAIAGNNAPQGLIGDVITALIPYSDDILIFGGDSSIYAMKGDPMAGGQIDRVSDAIGIAWGEAWCKDPTGNVYFVSNKTGIYQMDPQKQGFGLRRISQQIEELLVTIDTGLYGIRLIWNDRQQGLHVFVTLLSEPAPATHFFWDQRSNAWFTDTLQNNEHNPLCCATFDGKLPTDSVALIGSWDGIVRSIDPDATDDDGSTILSSVLIGPLLTKTADEIMVKELQGVFATGSGTVTYQVFVSDTAEGAIFDDPAAEGTFEAGRNFTDEVRQAGFAVYVKISGAGYWAMESIRVRLAAMGLIRQRGR